ncbi:hypothetical protein [Parabacteroides sp. FAFU027]|uniref:hypothetical protein n=1 Tax=Parabacteroides sp. FAFU027 TaxID=2922715 RepID=UPI001FAFA2B8|nr:hypothetical protein [Parabacteroides sp. FAFU027]
MYNQVSSILIILLISTTSSCTNKAENGDSKIAYITHTKYNSVVQNTNIDSLSQYSYVELYQKIKSTLKGASFERPFVKTKDYHFSNPNKPDHFIIEIPAGLIAKSKSRFVIKDNDGKTIYEETFDTHYLVRDIFDPETIPTESQEAIDRYRKKYIYSLTKKQFETFTQKEVDRNLNIFFCNRQDIISMNNDEGIINKEFYHEVISDSTLKIISLPCFDCDEGVYILSFSKQKGRVIRFMSLD